MNAKALFQPKNESRKPHISMAFLLFFALIWSACLTPETVPEVYRPNASHEEYSRALVEMGLGSTPMGQAWLEAGDPSDNLQGLSLPPFEELRFFDPGFPDAAWVLFEGIRGQAISIEIRTDSSAGYFADILGIPGDWDPRESTEEEWESLRFTPVASAASIPLLEKLDTTDFGSENPGMEANQKPGPLTPALQGSGKLEFEPRDQRFYLFRLQPRLLEWGNFTIRISARASLAWPIRDSDPSDIISVFGAARDGGARVHHGLDIVSPRNTDILSVSPSRVLRIGERERGGRTVTLYDDARELRLYYAHMESYGDVEVNDEIEAGVVLGGIGDSGNAFGTPPHLHIGLYDRSWRRPLDPWYFFIPVPDREIAQSSLETLEARNILPHSSLVANQELTLFRQLPGTNPTRVSPSIIDGDGDPIPQESKPITRMSWSQERRFGPGEPLGRVISLRGRGAVGILTQDRQVFWLPLVDLDLVQSLVENPEA